jgi:hypothetical protein
MALLAGSEFHRLWGGDEAQTFPDDGSEPPQKMYFPPVGGYRFGFFSLPPAGSAGPAIDDLPAATAEVEQKLPGLLQYMEPEHPGMHTTDTVDFEVVLHGEVVLELDDGAKETLHRGDTVVQNGTRHRWTNRSADPCTLVVCIVGATRA